MTDVLSGSVVVDESDGIIGLSVWSDQERRRLVIHLSEAQLCALQDNINRLLAGFSIGDRRKQRWDDLGKLPTAWPVSDREREERDRLDKAKTLRG